MWIYLVIVLLIMGLQAWYFDKSLMFLYFNEQKWHQDIHQQLEWDIALGVAIAATVILFSRYCSHHFQWAQRIDQDFREVFQDMPKYQLIILAIMSSVGEEVLFRGFLQSYWGLWWTSLVFGCLHIPMKKHHWPWTLMAIIMGTVFGGCYEWRGTLTAPLIAHFTINYFNLHALAKSQDPQKSNKLI